MHIRRWCMVRGGIRGQICERHEDCGVAIPYLSLLEVQSIRLADPLAALARLARLGRWLATDWASWAGAGDDHSVSQQAGRL